MIKFNYCPNCGTPLGTNDAGLRHCYDGCREFTHYDNPVPVVSCLIPMQEGIVLVQRGVEPFKGHWCLPCGFIDQGETPKVAAAREALEETRLVVRHEKLLSACAPSMSEKKEDSRLNVLVVFYMSRPVGGRLMHGDDAVDAKIFHQGNLPDICFRSHQMVVDEYFKGTWGQLTGKDL
jgi:ADP-ribose pyrophosphatase YjhB (NUDIX family)